MGKGRLPKLSTQKALQGTDRKDRQKEGIEFTQITIVPKPEVWLEPKAKKNFKNLCKMLIEKGLLTNANVGHVLIMAQEFATYEKATRELQKSGEVIVTGKNDYEQPSPWVAIRNVAQKNYRDIASLFGLDPLSGMKVGSNKKTEKDPFDEMTKKYDQ
jgi:P27 family predicted phage terminase small subunit